MEKTPQEKLHEAIRETMTPQAVALVAAYLQGARCNDPGTEAQVRWFDDLLTEVVGGHEAHNELLEEIGL